MGSRPAARPRWGIWLFFLLAIGLLALAAVVAVTAYQWRYSDRVFPGVRVAGIPLDDLTLDEAAAVIRDGLTPYPAPPVVVRYGERSWSFSAADLGVAVDARATAATAYAVGRRGAQGGSWAEMGAGLRDDLVAQWQALRHGLTLPPIVKYDEGRVALALKRIAQEVDLPPQEGTLSIAGLEVTGSPGRPGRFADVQATRAALTRLVEAGQGGEVALVVRERLPAVREVDAAVAKATTLINSSLLLTANGLDGPQRYAVDQATLRSWLALNPLPAGQGRVDLGVQLDEAQLTAFIQGIAEQLNRPVYDALLDFDRKTGQVIVLRPSQPGQTLDVAAAVRGIQASVEAQVAPAADGGAAPSVIEMTLPVTLLQPKVDSNKIAEMGIVEQVSEGTTYFRGSPAERVQNIVTAAEKIRGTVIPPGEVFSFNRIVGDVTAANGFVDSLIIRGDRTETGVGGGVCQVSTTAFRAAFWGGFPIIERWPHSYVVSWYGEPGLDASIFTPDVDFRFRNDTGHYLLIQPEVDTAKGRITFYFYGTKPKRTVEMAPPEVTNIRPAPAPLYQEDATLPKGVIKPVDWAKEGKDVLVKRIVRTEDGKERVDKFVSRYRPWQAVFLYGPGTQLPPEASGGAPTTPTP